MFVEICPHGDSSDVIMVVQDSSHDEGYAVVVTVVLFEHPLFEHPLGIMMVGSIETFAVVVVIMVA